MSETQVRKVSEIVLRDDLYPRIKKDVETVQKYAEDLAVLPPIEVNQHNELIDGWHRWTAHKKMEVEAIAVRVTVTQSDAHLLELAIERNSAHGLQLSQEDKQAMARRIYHVTPESERVEKKKHLATILSVSPSTVQNWLSRIDKDAKDERNKRIRAKWLACWTNLQIGESEGLTEEAIRKETQLFPDLEKVGKSAVTLATYSEPCSYTTPKQQRNAQE